MEFKFIEEYHEKLNEYKKHTESIEGSLINKENEYETLAKNYEKFIGEGNLKEATNFKKAMKELEIEIEAEKDILKSLNKRIVNGDPDAADKAVQKYQLFVQDLEKEKSKIIEAAEKRKLEYMKSVKEIAEFNGNLRVADNKIQGIVNHVGNRVNVPHSAGIQVSDFIINSSQF